MKREVKRLMAYFYMPLIFVISGFVLLYAAAAPVIHLLYNVGSMVIAQDVPDFDTKLETIYTVNDDAALRKDTVHVSEVDWPAVGQQYGELSCERIGLSTPVYFGDSNDILRVGTGQYSGSFIPGYDRVIMLCSHNTTFFKPLQNVEAGDIFVFRTNYGVYEYEVRETRVADHKDATAYDLMKQEEELIMYTCYPFEILATTKTDRLFVYAKKISGPTVID